MSVQHKAIQTVDFEIDGIDWCLDVEFTGDIDVDNDTIDYEGGKDKKPNYLVVDGDCTWNKKKFKKTENVIIDAWYNAKGYEVVDQTLIDSYKKAYAEY